MTEATEKAVEKTVDFKAMGAVFTEYLAAPLELFLNTAFGAEDDADRKLKEAADGYRSDLKDRQDALAEKAKAVQIQIDECSAETERAVEALSAALSNDDEAMEAEAKQTVDDFAMKEFLAQRRLETLSRVKLTGDDQKYRDVLDAASDYVEIREEATEAANLTVAFIEELIAQLQEIRKKAENHDDPYGFSKKRMTNRVWPVIVSHDGEPDFSGASAGDEDMCKWRFARALCRREYDAGFNYSPAGEQLMKAVRAMYWAESKED